MKNNLLWGVVVLAALILVAVLLGSGANTSSVGTETQTNTTTTGNTQTTTTTSTPKPAAPKPVVGMKVSLGGIFNEQGSYQCDYESVTPAKRTSNVVYVSGGKLRGEFRSYETGKSTATLVVYDGSKMYVWTEGMSTGTVSEPKTIADLPGIIPQDVSSGRILGSGLNSVGWNCHAWSKDASLLAKPTYVTFY